MPTKIFDGDGKLRVGILFSGGASGFEAMRRNDPNYRELYEVAFGLTNNPDASGIAKFREEGIPVLEDPLDFPAFNTEAAAPMYERVVEMIGEFRPDVIVLSGFMRLVAYPFIERGEQTGEYSGKVFNVHPAPLSILTGPTVARLDVTDVDPRVIAELVRANNLRRKYKGEDAVTDAVINGEETTRSTVHIATEDFDEGPITVQSRPFRVNRNYVDRMLGEGNWAAVGNYARGKLQERMKWEGDGPCFFETLKLTATGQLGLEGGVVYIGNEPQPYGGLLLSA